MNVQIPVKWLQELLALCGPEDHELRERVMVSITAMDEQAAAPVVLPEPFTTLVRKNSWSPSCYEASPRSNSQEYGRQWADERINVHTEQQVRALLAGISAPAAVAVAVPDGWREKFAADVYADLAAADNQDVPLEEYPARILKVLDSIVGPRHPVVIKWRNDAIRNCIAIAYKYCRDPESHKYLKQDLEAMLTTEPAPQAQADALDAGTFEQRMSDWQHGDALDAARYRWLRSRDLETISQGGVFAGMTPQNVILNEEDLDEAVDAAIAAQTSQQTMIVQS